ncbi:hypothetical protein G6F57_002609 [Rhizopus arrhizus]|uniref:polynucleotide adenylyltransferase n=1 Tax=Rhizopus oryzae TaxID=64495 RepID=A0A9P6XGG2_RHIOR|nr:hypothetical protein G6F23_001211 [Rhizopus arrhizus]KAG1425956.1 hypothetical protein G6F58_001689 [Rhizopus delemar]KAG0765171.1 hypothetical protein G6F24_004634 [Rhizopus arrhizus]KAG0797645.1 hypothetical protein G6F21_000364 [Rhizopus arrhizus]KAG0802035.1 hypothetical protein G6F22_000658 [Rhizopus arrhizus]
MTEVQKNISNEDWLGYLERYKIIETEEEKIKRKNVIDLLQNILVNFQRAVTKDLDWKRSDIECFLSPFGSYALGGYIRDADIDLVLVCPIQVLRKYFFKFFPQLLKQQASVSNVESIQKANVPIIKCTIDNISIDISFVRLKVERVAQNINFLDDSLLKDIDETCLASMDGPRVNQFCKNQIYRQHVRLFQVCLQCIKHWAIQRGIYSKPIGYLNGSSWTLLLVKAYMSIKNKELLSVTMVLTRFFSMWSQWPWQTPVMLTDYIPGINGTKIEYNSLAEFDNAVMPIVSPCYPVCNVAPYVTKSTRRIMQIEFERGWTLLNKNAHPFAIIDKLFNPVNYTQRYKHFINIVTSSTTIASHDTWVRKMATQIPRYLELIESDPNILQAQPITKPKQITVKYRTTQEKISLQNGDTLQEAKLNDFAGTLNPGTLHLAYYIIGIIIDDSCKELDLTGYSKSFLSLLNSKRNRRDEDVSWAMKHIKRKDVAALLDMNTE